MRDAVIVIASLLTVGLLVTAYSSGFHGLLIGYNL